MKIIEHGDMRGPRPSWEGRIVMCPCGFKAELERGDKVETGDQRDPGTWIECPTCKKPIQISSSNWD